MLLPHSWEEGCEMFLMLASSYYRNQSLAPFVRQVSLQSPANSQGRAGLSLGPCEELGVQVCRSFCHFFPPIFNFRNKKGWKFDQRLCHCSLQCAVLTLGPTDGIKQSDRAVLWCVISPMQLWAGEPLFQGKEAVVSTPVMSSAFLKVLQPFLAA